MTQNCMFSGLAEITTTELFVLSNQMRWVCFILFCLILITQLTTTAKNDKEGTHYSLMMDRAFGISLSIMLKQWQKRNLPGLFAEHGREYGWLRGRCETPRRAVGAERRMVAWMPGTSAGDCDGRALGGCTGASIGGGIVLGRL
jgi:hypothetical protein